MTTVGDYFESVAVRGIDEGIGAADGIVQSMQATPLDGSLELPVGPQGDPGATGPDAYPWRWEGDITDTAALLALAPTLGPAQAGKAWRVLTTNTVAYWTGAGFENFAEAIGGRGPDGAPNALTIGTVTTGAAGSDLVATISGTPPNQTLDLVVPQGVKGAKGPIGGPGPLREAADYDDSVAPTNGAVPVWDSAAAKWKPSGPPGWRGPWTVLEDQAWDGGAGFAAPQSNVSTDPNTICIVNVPAQDVAWRPYVTGAVLVRSTATDTSTIVDLIARIGSATGTTVAHGPGVAYGVWSADMLQPYAPDVSQTPVSTAGVIAAGTPAAIYLVLYHSRGTGAYYYQRTGAHAAVWAIPATGAP